MVVCGGVIPTQDYEALHAAGVAAVFGPGTRIPAAAQSIIADLSQQLAERGRDDDDGDVEKKVMMITMMGSGGGGDDDDQMMR